MGALTRFAIAYSPWFSVLATALGTGPRRSRLEVSDETVTIEMGWAFSARIPHGSVAGAAPHPPIRSAIGVHTAGRGDWIVNGTTRDIVEVRIDPPVRARALGVPVSLRRLRVSVDRPEAFLDALSAARPPA